MNESDKLKEQFLIILKNRFNINILDFDKNISSYLSFLQMSRMQEVLQFKKLLKGFILRRFGGEINISESVYIIYNGIKERPVCQQCGKEVSYVSFNYGYCKSCSQKCAGKTGLEKNKETCLKKYGVEYFFQTEEFKKRTKETCLKKYGVEYASQSEEFQEKVEETSLRKYGVEHSAQSSMVRNKYKETCLRKYGVENVSQVEEIREKIRQSIQKIFENEYKAKEIKEKRRRTSLKRYGVENPFQSKIVQDKYIRTNLERYGVKWPQQNSEIQEKTKQKYMKTCFERLFNSNRLKSLVIPLFELDDYEGTDRKYPFRCNLCKQEFYDHLNDGHIPRCPICFPALPALTSKPEKEIADFCKKFFPNLIENDRTILNGLEIDILVPEKNLGIEFDGLYWHSESRGQVSPNYHLNKTLKCEEEGIQLIHIFEDEWRYKQDIVKSILLSKFGEIDNKIYARCCNIQEVSNSTAGDFLFDNHLQGPINGKHFGLFYEDELVCLLTIGKPRFNKNYEYEILRFANKLNSQVLGGFSRLLKYFIRNFNPENIITYADMRFSQGNIYEVYGFDRSGRSSPNYFYIINEERESRLKYQKHKLSKILKNFDPNLTEWENMQLNGYDRIWDCGNYIYEWRNKCA